MVLNVANDSIHYFNKYCLYYTMLVAVHYFLALLILEGARANTVYEWK